MVIFNVIQFCYFTLLTTMWTFFPVSQHMSVHWTLNITVSIGVLEYICTSLQQGEICVKLLFKV